MHTIRKKHNTKSEEYMHDAYVFLTNTEHSTYQYKDIKHKFYQYM